jgi:hypothetical protein
LLMYGKQVEGTVSPQTDDRHNQSIGAILP